MIKFEKTEVIGWPQAICAIWNSMNNREKSDSGICKGGNDGIGCDNCATYGCSHTYDNRFKLGKNDLSLMRRLRNAGTEHRKFMQMIVVYVDVTAPIYWWKEFDPSCSLSHKIEPFTYSFNQKRTLLLNYEKLANIYEIGVDPKLEEWSEFLEWIESLPYSELIINSESLKYAEIGNELVRGC